jgi:ubiquinone/menaquinone biosynthesis C-methylase UbiE
VDKYPKWQYDELAGCGSKHNDTQIAEQYDSFHTGFRDFDEEARQIIIAIGMEKNHIVIDMGCGTGAFTIPAAARCKKVYAVDIAEAMLKRCREKADRAGLSNIEFHNAGFLTYEHTGEPADAIVSSLAMHHLPDFWKQVAFHRLKAMLKKGGRLYLQDAVFNIDLDDYPQCIEKLINTGVHAGRADEQMQLHIRSEYSTFCWVIEGMLEKAGFKVDAANSQNNFIMSYLCTKTI